MNGKLPLQRLSTGSDALDAILGGGIPAHYVMVIAGTPGAGKTVLTLQLLFGWARQGRPSLYCTTLSEPAIKLLRSMQLFSFFDADDFDRRIRTLDLGLLAREKGVAAALARVKDHVEADAPEIVAIDSMKALHDLVPDRPSARVLVHDLATTLGAAGVTTLLVGEYLPDDTGTSAEFAIADGILQLSHESRELATVRECEVLKLRGAEFVTGRHFFDIGSAGLAFYPRVRGPQRLEGTVRADGIRVPTGLAGLDALLAGGVPASTTTIVQGGPGTGKTLLGLHFLVEGAQRGEPGLLLTLEETPDQLRAVAANYGWDLPALESAGRLLLHYTSPVELSTDRFLTEARDHVRQVGARRLVLDSLSSASLGVTSERRFRELIYATARHLRASDVTSLMTLEVPQLLGSGQIGGHGLSAAADTLVLLRYVEIEGRLERAVSVLKSRGVRHDTELRRLRIGPRGAEVGSGFGAARGVITGVPTWEAAGNAPEGPAE
jgi:circadian clock protein KaiC